jgi:hypothetical protein
MKKHPLGEVKKQPWGKGEGVSMPVPPERAGLTS